MQFSQGELCELKEQVLGLVDQFVQLLSHIQTFRAIQSHRSALQPPECPTATSSELREDPDTLKEWQIQLAAASGLPAVTDCFCAPDVLSFRAVFLPPVANLDRITETLKQTAPS
jgi:hypothetical protein